MRTGSGGAAPRRMVLVAVLSLLAIGSACMPVPPSSFLRAPGGDLHAGGPGERERYVSLGDSWISGPLVPDMYGTPLGCVRSSRNAPALIAQELGVDEFVDVSCGGAKISHLTEPQKPILAELLGAAPPQLDALTPDTTLVTLGIAGNDIEFPNIALRCVNIFDVPLGPPPFGEPCRDGLTEGGVDSVSETIAATGPRLVEALREIHRRAPRARVLVIGYPTALPHRGGGCWPRVPILDVDVEYLRDKFVEMNDMLRAAARRGRAEFVDTYTSSEGHDVCRPVGTAWVNGLTLDPPAAPMHPNAMSLRHTATITLEAIRARR